MTNLGSVLKSRNVTSLTKVHMVKAKIFPVVMYGCESWFIKKAKHQRTDAFKLWCWRRLLRLPWTARRSNQSVLNGNPDYSGCGKMGNPNFIGRTDAETELSILWRPDVKSQLTGKDLCASKIDGKEKGSRGWDGWIASLTQWTWIWANSGRQWRPGEPKTLQSTGSQGAEYDLATEQQQAT